METGHSNELDIKAVCLRYIQHYANCIKSEEILNKFKSKITKTVIFYSRTCLTAKLFHFVFTDTELTCHLEQSGGKVDKLRKMDLLVSGVYCLDKV
jgi:hypothetical protein